MFNSPVLSGPPLRARLPFFPNATLLLVFTCKSISSEAAALSVSVALNFSPVNVTAPSFHVCAASITGEEVVTVPLAIVSSVPLVVRPDAPANVPLELYWIWVSEPPGVPPPPLPPPP